MEVESLSGYNRNKDTPLRLSLMSLSVKHGRLDRARVNICGNRIASIRLSRLFILAAWNAGSYFGCLSWSNLVICAPLGVLDGMKLWWKLQRSRMHLPYVTVRECCNWRKLLAGASSIANLPSKRNVRGTLHYLWKSGISWSWSTSRSYDLLTKPNWRRIGGCQIFWQKMTACKWGSHVRKLKQLEKISSVRWKVAWAFARANWMHWNLHVSDWRLNVVSSRFSSEIGICQHLEITSSVENHVTSPNESTQSFILEIQ